MPEPAPSPQSSLGASARTALLWGGGFILLRDVAQFGVMLILVRLLSPADYGTAAFAQSIVGLLSTISFSTFSLHALQIRDPKKIDWQAHFTAAVVINIAIFALVLLVAFALKFTTAYRDLGLPLAALALGFIVEIPATLRARMLEVGHEWKRFRVQLIIGTVLGMGVGLTVAFLGGGAWALILQPPMLGLPAAFDLLVLQRFRPDWSWSRDRYRNSIQFGLNRIGSGLFGRARAVNENLLLSSVYDLATLGIFTRANGLAALLAGRIGATAMTALYPVVTRTDRRSPRFQRIASLVLRGVCWTTMLAVAFLAVTAHDTVLLLYGPQWESVIPLLPLAAAATGIVGVWNALSSLLVANDEMRPALSIDVLAALTAIALAFVLVPQGARTYLFGLAVHAVVVSCITISVMLRKGAISAMGVTMAIIPSIVAGVIAAMVTFSLRAAGGAHLPIFLRVLLEGTCVAVVYIVVLRVVFRNQLAELLSVSPGGSGLARLMLLSVRRERIA